MKPFSELEGVPPDRTGTVADEGIPAVCPKCKGAGTVLAEKRPAFGEPWRDIAVVPCDCRRQDLARQRLSKLLAESKLGPTLRAKTFETFTRPTQKLEDIWTRAQHFSRKPEGWLIFSGPVGAGKTHLAAAIANARIELGEPVLFETVPYLLDQIRFTYRDDATTDYRETIQTVQGAELLILDDLGTQKTTEWTEEKLFQILNHRYNKALPTVVTTNLAPSEMEPRLHSRLCAGGISTVVEMPGKPQQHRFPGGSN